MYDSRDDTVAHIQRVGVYLFSLIRRIRERSWNHDMSKLKHPEKELFDKYTPQLRDLTYGSDEYKKCLSELKPALDHHYANNSHHPEHYKEGIAGMDLVDVIEMLADWKAASERHADGDIKKSLEINKKRFNISDDLYSILCNTVDRYMLNVDEETKICKPFHI